MGGHREDRKRLMKEQKSSEEARERMRARFFEGHGTKRERFVRKSKVGIQQTQYNRGKTMS